MDPQKEHICDLHLHQIGEDVYGERFRDHVLEQYKLYIRSIDYTSRLKHTVNSYFLTINTLLVSAVGVSITKDELFDPSIWHSVVPFIGLLISIAWWITTRRYKEVNLAKFEILHCIEKMLPLALYKTEWEILRGNNVRSMHKTLFLEPVVPWLFAIMYVLIFFFVK